MFNIHRWWTNNSLFIRDTGQTIKTRYHDSVTVTVHCYSLTITVMVLNLPFGSSTLQWGARRDLLCLASLIFLWFTFIGLFF